MKFSIKDFFSICDQIRKTGKLLFLYRDYETCALHVAIPAKQLITVRTVWFGEANERFEIPYTFFYKNKLYKNQTKIAK